MRRTSSRPSHGPPPSQSDSPPSAGGYNQEFLYHLYRGSELLQDNSVDDAKAELERALKLQPKDVEGQGLLGIVYFRLGLYPRAIEIYESLCRSVPAEVTPRINLALCYLKTGQTEAARDHLDEVLRLDPQHKRAWGYIGLVYQRFGDFDKARVAFERGGHEKMAERMAALCTTDSVPSASEIAELGPVLNSSAPAGSFRPSLMPKMPPPSGVPKLEPVPTVAPSATMSPPARPDVPVQTHRFVQEHELVFPETPKVVRLESGQVLARIDGSLAVRPDCIALLSHDRAPFTTQNLRRRTGGKLQRASLGADGAKMVSLLGTGRVVLAAPTALRLTLLQTDAEALHVLERHVVAFEPSVQYETGTVDPLLETAPIAVSLTGKGVVVISSTDQPRCVELRADRPLVVRTEVVLGWLGSVTPRLVPAVEAPAGLGAMIGFSGTGSVLLDLGRQTGEDPPAR